MTQQEMFGGSWTERKLQVLSKYLREYRRIFAKNQRAQFFRVAYVDAFAGTGVIPQAETEATLLDSISEVPEAAEEFRKGSVRRALEVDPPFHSYVFIEKDRAKCEELLALKDEFPGRDIDVIREDANTALLAWCRKMNSRCNRAVIFLDPFGAAVEWRVIEAIGRTKAVDLWILFPYGAVNRMLTRGRKPSASWSAKLTEIFGTSEWESAFYSSSLTPSILDPNSDIESVHKTANRTRVVEFFADRLRTVFPEVAQPGFLFNSKSLLFVLFFAASRKTGLPIANHLLQNIAK